MGAATEGAPRVRDAATGPQAAGGTAWRSKRPPRKPSPATRSVGRAESLRRVELGSVRPRAQPQRMGSQPPKRSARAGPECDP